MPKAWSKKDERQYKHIVKSCSKGKKPSKSCKRIAAATVNTQRCKEGRAKTCGGKRVKLRGLGSSGEVHQAAARADVAEVRRLLTVVRQSGGCRLRFGILDRAREQLSRASAHADSIPQRKERVQTQSQVESAALALFTVKNHFIAQCVKDS